MDVFDSLSYWVQNIAMLLRQNAFWTSYLSSLKEVFSNTIDLTMNFYSSVDLDMRVRYVLIVLLLPSVVSLFGIMVLRSFGFALVVLGMWTSCAVFISGIVVAVYLRSNFIFDTSLEELKGVEIGLIFLGIGLGLTVLCVALLSLLHVKMTQLVKKDRREGLFGKIKDPKTKTPMTPAALFGALREKVTRLVKGTDHKVIAI